jgi:hypothetical protein
MEMRGAEGPPFAMPEDVIAWVKQVFADCNHRVTAKISAMPHSYETSLDMAFIEQLASVASPVVTASGWTIYLQTHYLGGGRHFPMWPDERRWEIADIGVLVLYRQAGQVVRAKAALLQSKRLYADEVDWDEDSPVDYLVGFGRLFGDDVDWQAVASPRRFTFTEQSRYKALRKGDHQYVAISSYERRSGVPVHYMLYNPASLPYQREVPAPAGSDQPFVNEVGCRVVPASEVHAGLLALADHASPRFADLPPATSLPILPGDELPGWRLEEFIADLVIQCRAGYVASSRQDGGLDYIFNRRGAPIAAAFAITIEAPPDG